MIFPRYQVATPDQYLAVTGVGIESIKICKSSWVYPLQRCMRFSVQPLDYAMNLQAMTKEKLQFQLPVVFTIGPDVDSEVARGPGAAARGSALIKFAMLLAEHSNEQDKAKSNDASRPRFLEGIVKGLIEGETRVLVSGMTMEEIFTGREQFKKVIYKNLQAELDQFGLRIYNCNIRELRDAPGSSYYESLSRKAHEGASNQARIDVAEAQRRGNVGEAQRHGEQERELARISAETAVMKTDRDAERAQAEANLATRQTALDRDVNRSRVQARRAIEAEDEALKKDVETRRAAAEMERLRATDVVRATIEREAAQQAADARAYETKADAGTLLEKRRFEAQADTFRIQQAAEADAYQIKQRADASNFAAIRQAEASLQCAIKGAQGDMARADALEKMSRALGGPQGLLYYRMIENGTFVELAKANAQAIQGLQPKITVWTTGPEAGSDNSGADQKGQQGGAGTGNWASQVRDVYSMLPPLMSTIHDQTGMTFPEWQVGKLAAATSQLQLEQASESDKKTKANGLKGEGVNGHKS